MTTLATIFRAILTDLQKVIAPFANNDPTLFLLRIYHHISRTMVRFEKLVAHWRAGTLPKQCKPRPGRPSHPRATPRFPTGYAWLIRSVDHYNARCHASQLQHFLATTEFIQFLAEVPRANRILRPLAKSLGIQMPGDPPRPYPKPAPKPKPAKKTWFNLPSAPVTVEVTVERRNPNFYHAIFSKAR